MRWVLAPAIVLPAGRIVGLFVGLFVGLVVGLIAGPVDAHVQASVSDNNRYLKLTPLGDRVRLAYTVFYGKIPGFQLRRTIDANHDGTIDDRESQVFGDGIARELAAALEVTVDSVRQPVAWTQVVVGMGTPETVAGAFSIDLVASLCLAAPRGRHIVQLRDRFALTRPGETEIRFEDSPGVTIDHARVGEDSAPGIDYKIVGPTPGLGAPGPSGGIELGFRAGDNAMVASDATCADAAPHRGLPIGITIGAAAAVALALASAVTIVRRRRR
jgi:hypothetical protein